MLALSRQFRKVRVRFWRKSSRKSLRNGLVRRPVCRKSSTNGKIRWQVWGNSSSLRKIRRCPSPLSLGGSVSYFNKLLVELFLLPNFFHKLVTALGDFANYFANLLAKLARREEDNKHDKTKNETTRKEKHKHCEKTAETNTANDQT